MRQAVLVSPRNIEFKNVEAPKAENLKAHEVLINVKRIGICGSEIHSYHGLHPATFYPVVQGHEYSAVVVAVGKDMQTGRQHHGSPAVGVRRMRTMQTRTV